MPLPWKKLSVISCQLSVKAKEKEKIRAIRVLPFLFLLITEN